MTTLVRATARREPGRKGKKKKERFKCRKKRFQNSILSYLILLSPPSLTLSKWNLTASQETRGKERKKEKNEEKKVAAPFLLSLPHLFQPEVWMLIITNQATYQLKESWEQYIRTSLGRKTFFPFSLALGRFLLLSFLPARRLMSQ